jgi:hypothetical protein
MRTGRIGGIVSLALLLWAGMALSRAEGQTALTALFPQSNEVAGWTLKEGPKFFRGDQLFDYMDGAAEIPKSYTFSQLGSAKYQQGTHTLEVAIFDMGTAASAFGYYSARSFLEHNPRSKDRIIALDHPARLYVAVGVLTFWKDHYTIIVQPDIGTPDEKTLLQFARAVSAKIKAKGRPPEMISLLPRPNLQAETVRYVRGKSAFDSLILFSPQDVFGMANKPDVVSAEYTLSGKQATLFVVRYPTSQAAANTYAAYRQFLSSRHAVFSGSSVPHSFVAMAPKEKGTGALTRGNYLGVVVGAKDAKAAATGLRSLLGTLPNKG